jgi:RNA polymerase sigma-70 factor (ECF subfamily)
VSEGVLDFRQIYTDFRPKIQRYLTRLVGEYEAEDLTQEVFVKISQALSTFRNESQLSTWIYRIATNAAIDRMRTPAYQRTIQSGLLNGSDWDEWEDPDQDVEIQVEAPSIEQQLYGKERLDCYCDFINHLPPNYRAVVALSDLEELAAKEIADILGLSLDAVKIRLHRGRTRLLEELKAHCKPEDWL